MSLKTLVEQYSETTVTQEEIDIFLPEAEKKLSLIINSEGSDNGERNEPYYLAMLVGEMINNERFHNYCFSESIKIVDEEAIKDKTKESTQLNVKMLPQTNDIVSY